MVVTDVISPTDASESPLTAVKFDNAIILRGENLANANRVVLVDEAGNEIAMEVKPAFVTDRAIIVKLDDITVEKTVAIRIYSKTCGANYAELKIDGYPAPVINGFYNEFTPDGGELRIAGNYYYGDVKVTFDLENGEKKEVGVTSNTAKELSVTVPAGVAEGSLVTVTTTAGSVTSKVKLRDRSQIFLNFDDLDIPAEGWTGALDPTTGQYNAGVSGYTLPEGCDGKFGALVQGHSWNWKTTNTMAYEQSARSKDGKEGHDQWNKTKCLLDLNTKWNGNNIDYKYDSNDYLLKFEVYVPENMPLKNWFDLAFYQYGSEYNSEGDFYNGGGFAPWDYMKLGDASALPAARLVLGDFDVKFKDNDAVYSYPTGIPGHEKGFYTSGWRTVAIPLTSEYFQFAPSDKSIGTSIKEGKSSGVLAAKEFFNMWISPEPNGMPQNEFFIAFDNFRIVKDDGNGLIPGVWGTGTTNGVESCVRDYFE